jgi:hypothetical protein
MGSALAAPAGAKYRVGRRGVGGDGRLEFTTLEGESITTDFIWWPSEYPQAGDRIDIAYNPEDPYYVVRAAATRIRSWRGVRPPGPRTGAHVSPVGRRVALPE